MSIDLFNLEPTIISRDLRGKIVTFFGEPKSGKTSTAVKFPKHLLIAFERGFNALNNVMAQPINKWMEFKKVLKQLNNEQVKEKFETVIIDTVDIAYDLCEKYICQREGVEKIGDVPYGGGYAMVRREFDEAIRSIPLMGYGLVMISHSKVKQFVDENGNSYDKTVMTLSDTPRLIVSRMSDIIGYSKAVDTDEGTKTRLFLRGTTKFEAGSRFKHIPDYIDFTYENLVNVIADAIEKQEQEDGVTATNEYINVYQSVTEEKTFDEVVNEAKEVITKIMENDENNASKISKIIETHLGKNKKLAEATEDQTDLIVLILDDLKDLLNE